MRHRLTSQVQSESRSLIVIENKICISCKEFLNEKRKDISDLHILRQRIQTSSLCERYRKSVSFLQQKKSNETCIWVHGS